MIPITFIDADRRETTNRVSGYPCIQTALVEYGAGKPTGVLALPTYWTLIDTGADHVYADPSVLAAAGAVPRGSTDVNQGGSRVPLYRCFLFILGTKLAIDVLVVERGLLAEGDAYSIVLGRSALEHFTLTFNANSRPSHLVQID